MSLRMLSFGFAAILLARPVVGRAGTPFGADDAGFLPPDAPKGPITKCESGVAKAVSKLAASIVKCHVNRTAGKLADDTAEDACEAAAVTTFQSKTKTKGCPACVSLATIGPQTANDIDDVNNGSWYCAPGASFGPDDTGAIPADAPKGPVTKCENNVAKASIRLAATITACHVNRASGKIAADAGEEGCEQAAIAKFSAKTKTVGCAPCTDLGLIGVMAEGLVDGLDSLTYCASPSGAFVDAF